LKDKARKQLGLNPNDDSEDIERQIVGTDSNKRVNAGLLTYPTLMAVDILIQKARKVPVGKDQEQHLELTRRFARRFNSFYGVDLFPEPENFNFGAASVKVPGLDGSGKMGKSEGNCIYLVDDEKVLRKKVMRAVTDQGPQEPNSPVSQPVENLFTLMALTSGPEVVQQYRDAYADCSIRYGDLKKQLAEDILKVTTPIRERYLDIRSDDAYLARVVRQGAERARERASRTLEEVRKAMGIIKFY
ncbi:MAG: tryptophan--tRNA ligase, partial [Duncaniella sp.]|nr:tryptophan--tRNA ligase [Duncaniella sp.]